MPTYRYECPADGAFEARQSIHVDSHVAECPVCGMASRKVFVSPQLSPRIHDGHVRRPQGPPTGNNNSWEKGRVTDHRGVPLVADTSRSEAIPVKEFAANRSKYEEQIRRLETHPNPVTKG